MEFEDGTKDVIGCFFEVYNALGCGFLEKVYENALREEFKARGIDFECQVPIKVGYKGKIVGDYFADFIVGDDIIVEVKAKDCLAGIDEMQLVNYLKGAGLRIGLLVNFGGEKLEFKRKVYG